MTHYANPRSCKHCGREYTPLYKKRKSVYCSLACQRAVCLDTSHNAEISRATADQRSQTLRNKGGVGYIKLHGKHEHRVVTKAPSGKVVHHIDNDPRNNDPSNLQVMTQSEHARLHDGFKNNRYVKPPSTRVCDVEGCGRKHLARGYCSMHYQKLVKKGGGV